MAYFQAEFAYLHLPILAFSCKFASIYWQSFGLGSRVLQMVIRDPLGFSASLGHLVRI